MSKPYRENDKIVVKETGEVFTVHLDLRVGTGRRIMIKENFQRRFNDTEVRPAGITRERRDLAKTIIEPEPMPPPLSPFDLGF